MRDSGSRILCCDENHRGRKGEYADKFLKRVFWRGRRAGCRVETGKKNIGQSKRKAARGEGRHRKESSILTWEKKRRSRKAYNHLGGGHHFHQKKRETRKRGTTGIIKGIKKNLHHYQKSQGVAE